MEHEKQFKYLEELFERARLLPPEKRPGFLDQACAGNPALRGQAEELIRRHERAGFLDDEIPLQALDNGSLPDRISCYEILGVLGRGGMGIVYRARQEHPAREVAIKVLRWDYDVPGIRRRFEFESEILARLQHPNIATIFEVGSYDDGSGLRPYFVMELIEGVALDRYVLESRPTLSEKLELFVSICEGVQHAHQKGIIHRDIKPQNILVDAAGVPKILDFGVARSMNTDGHTIEQTMKGELVGTLSYMSPEQVGMHTETIDTRTDVYALGVVLYEMLVGRLPYDMCGSSIPGVARIIVETPPDSLAKQDRALRGDLSTITMKTLRKDPDHRYQTASELASDIQRFLHHQPITARAPTIRYLAGRFVRRHRGLVAMMMTLLLSVSAALIVILWQASRVASESETREDVALFLKEMLTSLDPEKTAGEELTVRAMLDDASERLQERFASAPGVRGELHSTVGQTYHMLGEFADARRHLELAITDLSTRFGPRDERMIEAMAALGYTLRELGELQQAERVLVDARGRLASEDGPIAAMVRMNLATVLDSLGRDEEAVELSREGYLRSLASNGPDNTDTLIAQNNLGALLMNLRRLDEALPLLEESLRRRRAVFGDDHPQTIAAISNLGTAYTLQGDVERAFPLVLESAERSSRVLGPTHLRTLKRRTNIIRHHLATRDFGAASEAATVIVEDLRATLDPDHPELMSVIELTVTAYAFSGNIEGAIVVATDAYNQVAGIRGPLHPATGRAAYLLYNLYDEIGDQQAADQWREQTERSRYTP